MEFNLFNFVAIIIGIVIVELIFYRSRLDKAKKELIAELTKMIENNEEVTLTIVRTPKGKN